MALASELLTSTLRGQTHSSVWISNKPCSTGWSWRRSCTLSDTVLMSRNSGPEALELQGCLCQTHSTTQERRPAMPVQAQAQAMAPRENRHQAGASAELSS